MKGAGARVTFVGAWPAAERGVLVAAARSVEEYLGAQLPTRWRFERSGGGYLVSQPSLLLSRARAGTVSGLVGRIREAAEFAAPFEG